MGREDLDPETWFQKIGEDRPARTRLAAGINNLVQPIARLEVRRHFSHRVIAPWNRLPNKVKTARNAAKYKRGL